MNLFLHTSKFDTIIQLTEGSLGLIFRFGDLQGLHSLFLTNSTGVHFDDSWDYCFPTPFGFGIVADWLEEHSDRVLDSVTLNYLLKQGFSGDKKVALSLLVYELRRQFSEAAGR